MINVEMDVMTAAAVRESLFQDTKEYTYEDYCCPQRVKNIRNVIRDLDTKIEEALENEVTDS